MIFRGLTEDGDWLFGNGKSDHLTDEGAIEANIETALKVYLGEVFWDLNFGIDWRNLLGAVNPRAQAGIILQCRQMIITRYGVARILNIDATLDRYTRKLTVRYAIQTIFSRSVRGEIQPA